MLTHEDAQAIYCAGEETVVRVLLEMDVRIHALEQLVEDLQAQVYKLQGQLAKNSRNSSKPPSTDGFQKPAPKSLREKSARPSGGQPGHSGQTHGMVEKPDHTERHRVERCTCCGRSLAQRAPEPSAESVATSPQRKRTRWAHWTPSPVHSPATLSCPSPIPRSCIGCAVRRSPIIRRAHHPGTQQPSSSCISCLEAT
jgi:hypothetical protein